VRVNTYAMRRDYAAQLSGNEQKWKIMFERGTTVEDEG